MAKTEKKNSAFIESLEYSREKCMMFHGLNFVSIALFIIFFTIVIDNFIDHTFFLIFAFLIPLFILGLSFYLVAKHDLSYIETKRENGSAIWRDNIEYKISKFAKKIFFQK